MIDRMKILIIDDDERILRMLKRRLEKNGYEVTTTTNGHIGIDLAFELNPSIIILDIHMPIIDGYDVIKTLRAKGYKGKVTACTASVGARDSQKTIDAGCDYFISKPIDNQFEDRIKEIINV